VASLSAGVLFGSISDSLSNAGTFQHRTFSRNSRTSSNCLESVNRASIAFRFLIDPLGVFIAYLPRLRSFERSRRAEYDARDHADTDEQYSSFACDDSVGGRHRNDIDVLIFMPAVCINSDREQSNRRHRG
jgi:hypothetical protein